ncbi:unnamed protein product [Rotaria sordida]|uniref:EF-hand domain-containing protein n=1 Tax=Rotaria sordida TaxID=392033 RepID=A0A815VBX4_9BILA|nr:unnamed protein product [Rotaria sordida]
MKNKFMTLNDKGIEAWYKKFMTAAYPNGELNKEDFIATFQELYPCGNSGPYCNYVFNTIDKDQSGTINFVEFMSALSLSVLGDIEKQLTLVFAICAGDSSEKVSSEELIKFLELVAELEGGEDAIDSHAAKLIVEKIMKSSDEERDDKNITEKEFLSCLKEDDELAITFLPIIGSK